MTSGATILQNLLTRYKLWRWAESILLAFACALAVFTLCQVFIGASASIVTGVASALLLLAARLYVLQLPWLTTMDLALYLNRSYSRLEHSADLLLNKSTDVDALSRLQSERAERLLIEELPTIRLPNRLVPALALLVLSVLLAVWQPRLTERVEVPRAMSSAVDMKVINPAIESIRVTIKPPAYTAQAETNSEHTQVECPEGSEVQWQVELSTPVDKFFMVIAGRDTLYSNSNQSIRFSRRFVEPAFYQFGWIAKDSTFTSDYFAINVTTDQHPSLDAKGIDQFTEFRNVEEATQKIVVTVRDDYGLSDVHMIATVSKGSGESVKFREEKLNFEGVMGSYGRQVSLTKVLDLKRMGLEPGDELYFYVVARDNKQPVANTSRTETFFMSIEDTTQLTASLDEGLGVDLMPEYFRSQRQIIIDTEKLISNQKRISRDEFNSTSNELGYDQKVLRLRYGQFLGEEFETSVGPGHSDDHEEGDEGDVIEEFGHQHDTENEHNLVPAQEKEGDKSGKQQTLEEFAHSHDNTDEATFFIQSIKAKLRAALTLMWDSELQLRMFKPAESLPYQYRILKLLKEISNDSRIYVRRTGFDPPPLKEDRRLSADLSEIKGATVHAKKEEEVPLIHIQQALEILAGTITSTNRFSSKEKETMRMAAREVAAVDSNPIVVLEALSSLKILTDTDTIDPSIVTQAMTALMKLLPDRIPNPGQVSHNNHELEQVFLNLINP